MMDTMSSVKGAQSIARAGAVLRIVASTADGATTTDVVTGSGLTRPTVHRLLSALAAEGLVDQDNRTGHWFPGPELYLMGSIAAERYDIGDVARETVASLAARTGESAFLSVRRADETVCLIREEGSFPIRSFVLYEGARFPLGVASAGLAILAFMVPSQIDAYFRRAGDLTARWGAQHSEEPLRRRLAEVRQRGYAVNPALIVEGSWGMGAAVFDKRGEPAWALSITGVEFRFGPERQAELGALLLEHAHEISKRLQ